MSVMPFRVAEEELRAMVGDPRWAALPAPLQARAIADRTLVTPDGGRWQFGARARWYLQDPRDGHWHLAPPPPICRVVQLRHTEALPLGLLPRAADLGADRGSSQAFIGPDVPTELTDRIRELVRADGRRPVADFPMAAFRDVFAADVPGTVAAVWGTIMWCGYAPAFDGNERLLSVFGEYLGRSLPGDEWVRWLPTPPLTDLVALYAGRIRTRNPRAALRIAALATDVAGLLRADARFRPRARALRSMLKPVLANPGLDDQAATAGDDQVLQAWLARVPARLAGAILDETDPAEHFRHRVYDLVETLSFTPDPIWAAATFLAADLAPGEEAPRLLTDLLDHRLRHALYAVRSRPRQEETGGFALPYSGTGGFAVPAGLMAIRPPGRESAAAVLGAVYATGLAWCRLTGARPPATGFPSAPIMVGWLIHERDDIPT